MRIVIQRVKHASVTIGGQLHSAIGGGMLVLVGIAADDTEEDIAWLAAKICNLRIFDDEDGVMNRSILETGGDILAVSQFTLMALHRRCQARNLRSPLRTLRPRPCRHPRQTRRHGRLRCGHEG